MKRFLGVACALLILFVNAPMAFAASSSPADAVDTENFDDALEYISSQEVKSQIYNEIDFNKDENCKCKLDTCTVEISSSERRA